MTYDGAVMRLYVNGTQVATRNQTGSTVVSAGPLQIGGNTIWNNEWFTGADRRRPALQPGPDGDRDRDGAGYAAVARLTLGGGRNAANGSVTRYSRGR